MQGCVRFCESVRGQIERAGFKSSMLLERKKDEGRLNCVVCMQICYISAVV